MDRGGQVLFRAQPRRDDFREIAAKIQTWFRKRASVGHGQMGERELEKVMLKFMRHEADILVSTTIIENGLDIPRAIRS